MHEVHKIVWLDVTTPQGGFMIQGGHAPMIVMLQDDKPFIFALENGVQKSVQARSAILLVDRTRAVITMNESLHG